jgi:hypothetical protein
MADDEAARPAPRGDAAWKAHLARVAARNDEARRVGKQQRQEKERVEQTRRAAQERRVDSELTRSVELDR